MNRLEELLAQWEAGVLTSSDAAELKQLLADPRARQALVEDWMWHEAIYGALQAQSSLQAQAAPPRAATSPSLGERFAGWLAHLRQPGWRWAVGGAAAALVVALALFFLLPGEPVARLSAVQGEVVVEKGGNAGPAVAGQPLYSGDALRVVSGGGAIIAWPREQTLVKLWPGARFRLETRQGVKRLELTEGQLFAVVAPQPSGKPMTLRTPQAEAVVKGTRFSLAVTAQATRLEVMEGAVAMRAHGPGAAAPVTVTAGNAAVSTPAGAVQLAALTGRVTRELIALPAGSDPLTATGGRLLWRETVDRLEVRGWPLGVAPVTNAVCRQRLRGYLTPPAAGEYAFWISSATPAELWLSTDDRPENGRRVATAAPPGSEAAGAGRRSAPQPLAAGKRLYFEVLHQGGGGEPLAVGWVRPGSAAGGSLIEILSGDVLSPWVETNP